MLDNTTNNFQSHFNAPATGIIQKSDTNSFFINFHLKSNLCSQILSDEPEYKNKKVKVLQIIMTHDDFLIAEIIKI